jgi:orotate phosphoribosyltransferase
VLQHPADAAALGSAVAERVRDLRAAAVISPALGGLIIGHEVARALGVRAIFAERSGGTTLSLRRGFSLSPGERVLVVEDVFTTGKSTRETMDLARESGAEVVGAAAIIDRSGGTMAFDVPHKTVIQLALPTYDADQCPLCKLGVPVTKPGSRPT